MGLPRGLLELCGHLGAVLPRGHERPSLQATSLPLTQCPAVLQQPPTPLPPPTHTAYGGRGRSPAAGAVSALPLGLPSAVLF